MQLTREETIRRLQEAEELCTLFTPAPLMPAADGQVRKPEAGHPLLSEAPFNHDISVQIYDKKEECAAQATKLWENKMPCLNIVFNKENQKALFLHLLALKVDVIRFTSGEDKGFLSMKDQFFTEYEEKSLPDEAHRCLARDVQLYWQAIIFNQSKGVDRTQGRSKNAELLRLSALSGSLMRAGVYVPVLPDKKDPKKLSVLYFAERDAKGNVRERQLLAYTDYSEVRRQFGKQAPPCKLCKLEELVLLVQNADKLILNKMTSGIVLTKELLNSFLKNQKLLASLDAGEKEEDAATLKMHLSVDEKVYVLYTAVAHEMTAGGRVIVTLKNPFIREDPETFDDQCWLFAREDEARAYAKELAEQKKLFTVPREIPNRGFAELFMTLAAKAVNMLCYYKDGKRTDLELGELTRTDLEEQKVDEKGRPVLFNPTLQLCAEYYSQELARKVKLEERSEEEVALLVEKSNEYLANLKKAKVYVRGQIENRDGQDQYIFSMEQVRNAAGEVLTSEYFLFTDLNELNRFYPEGAPNMLLIPFERMKLLMKENCTGICIDPAGVEFRYSKDNLLKMLEA